MNAYNVDVCGSGTPCHLSLPKTKMFVLLKKKKTLMITDNVFFIKLYC